ncbi:hypothetical protein EVAR_9415_1 [Eumeta japonica]|uniref:HTH psq-type domain-containing protein n=1 Tax=Eumeta variegata TaxID=151549 RepID=A0A4C1UDW9_EUMVA|nr:hypothetical protein EVAR_9415_1 [Eumeta japonica]
MAKQVQDNVRNSTAVKLVTKTLQSFVHWLIEHQKNMVRNHKKNGTRSGEVDEQAMLKAIDEILENNFSLRKSATKYGVNAQTLQSPSGNTIPPLFIFPRVHYKDHFLEGAPEGSLGVATRSVQVYHSNPVTTPNKITGGEELAIADDELATVSAELGDVPARTPPTLSRNVSPSFLSQHFASTVIDFDNPAPSTSKVLKTLEMIRPFPKVQKCTQTKKGSSLGKSRIYTDTPEKTRIEKLEKIKEKRLEKERKSKEREIKRAFSLLNKDCDKSSKPKRKKTKEIETISSDSETDAIIMRKFSFTFRRLKKTKKKMIMKSLLTLKISRTMPMCL